MDVIIDEDYKFNGDMYFFCGIPIFIFDVKEAASEMDLSILQGLIDQVEGEGDVSCFSFIVINIVPIEPGLDAVVPNDQNFREVICNIKMWCGTEIAEKVVEYAGKSPWSGGAISNIGIELSSGSIGSSEYEAHARSVDPPVAD